MDGEGGVDGGGWEVGRVFHSMRWAGCTYLLAVTGYKLHGADFVGLQWLFARWSWVIDDVTAESGRYAEAVVMGRGCSRCWTDACVRLASIGFKARW